MSNSAGPYSPEPAAVAPLEFVNGGHRRVGPQRAEVQHREWRLQPDGGPMQRGEPGRAGRPGRPGPKIDLHDAAV